MADEESAVDVTNLLRRMSAGDPTAANELLPLIYGQLRAMAHRAFASQAPNHTLQPTALVHEAYIKLAGRSNRQWNDRSHFMAVAARAMRQVITDHARGKNAAKRGGRHHHVTLGDIAGASNSNVEVLMLDELLDKLRELNSRHAQLVELRVFAGFNLDQIAEHLGVSKRTLNSDWRFVRAWLQNEMRQSA